MKIVVSVYVSPNYVFCWLLVVSLEIFIAVSFVFSRSLNIAWRSTQNAARVSNDFEDYTKIKPLNKKKIHNKFFIMFERNSINVPSNIRPHLALQKWEPAGRISDFGIFF